MSYSAFVQKHRVTIGFMMGLLFLYLSRPNLRLFSLGIIIILLGLALRFWAAGYLHKATKLTTSGPYGYTRNPLYLGSFLWASGFMVAGGNLVAAIAVVSAFVFIYLPTMRREEAELRNGFREQFDRYASHVPLFLPRLKPYTEMDKTRFSLLQVLRNREQNAMMGCAVAVFLIYLKLRLFS